MFLRFERDKQERIDRNYSLKGARIEKEIVC